MSFSDSFTKLTGRIGISLSFDIHKGFPFLKVGLKKVLLPDVSLAAIGAFLAEKRGKITVVIDEFQQKKFTA